MESFTQTVPAGGVPTTWDQSVTFTIIPTRYDYLNVLCTLPGGMTGLILGVTSVQP
jgi:hypothetical protein